MFSVLSTRGFVVHQFGAVGWCDTALRRYIDVAALGSSLVDGAFSLRAARLGVCGYVGAVFVVEGFIFGVGVWFLVYVVEVGDGKGDADADENQYDIVTQ